MPEDLTLHLIALEQSLHTPAVRRDAGTLLAEDFREFGSSGRIWSRAEILQALATESPVQITSRDFACQLLAPGLALLTYTSESTTRRAVRSSLWRLEGDQWRIVFHQGTPIP